MKMFIQKQSMICMEISIYYVHLLHTVHYVSSFADSFLIVSGPVLSLFRDDFCEVVLSGMNTVNVALQKSHIDRRHLIYFGLQRKKFNIWYLCNIPMYCTDGKLYVM